MRRQWKSVSKSDWLFLTLDIKPTNEKVAEISLGNSDIKRTDGKAVLGDSNICC